MSAEVLREAAAVARRDWESESVGVFARAARIHLAVADWLDATANNAPEFNDALLAALIRQGTEQPSERTRAAVAVARAYLGTPDRSRPGLGTAGVTGAQPDEPASQAGRPVAGGGS